MTALSSREQAPGGRRVAGRPAAGKRKQTDGGPVTTFQGLGPGFFESLDRNSGMVRCTGHLSEQGTDLIRGAVEALRRQGHDRVTVDLHAVHTADEEALAELRSLSQRMRMLRSVVVVLLGEEEGRW